MPVDRRPSRARAIGIAIAISFGAAAARGGTGDGAVVIGGAAWHRAEWRANAFTSGAQAEASLALAEDGAILVVWSSRRQQEGRSGVYAQRFDRDGAAVGGERAVNLWRESHHVAPAAGAGWVAWQAHGQDGDLGAILARRLDRGPAHAAVAGGAEVLVNQETRGHQAQPAMAELPGGAAIVAWTSVPPGGTEAVRWRVLRGAGVTGVEHGVADAGAIAQRTPAIAAAGDGAAILAYAAAGADGRPVAVHVVRIETDSGAADDPVALSGPGAIEPTIACGAEGAVVAWLERAPGRDGYAVMARRLDRCGRPIGTAFAVSEDSGPQSAAAVAVAPGGSFALAWNAPDASGSGVWARVFDATGAARSAPVRVNGHAAGDQRMKTASAAQRIAFTGSALLCAWDGDGGSGDAAGVHVTMLSAAPPAAIARGPGAADSAGEADGDLGLASPHLPPTFDPARRVEDGQRIARASASGFGFTGIFDSGWTPPDPHLAVGPNEIVLITNGAIAFFTKAGGLLFEDEIEGSGGFWGSVGASTFVFDPEALFDPLSGRFFVMASDQAPGGQSFALVAVSDDAHPQGSWHRYRFNTTPLAGGTLDSPNISVDASAVYVTGDKGGPSSVYPVFIYDKASLLAGNPPLVQNSTTVPTSTESAGIPPVSLDAPPALYMIEHREGAATSVRLVALRNGLTTPLLSETTLTVPPYNGPEDPPQAGTSSVPETFDARFWSVAYRNGSLWAAHHVGSTRVLARWYEIAMKGWPTSGQLPAIVQSGTIDPAATARTFFPAITVDGFGNASIVFARSAPSEFISMQTAFRYKSDPLGTFRAPVTHATSSGPYVQGRWGDYGGIGIDPADGKTSFAHHEYAEGQSWRTWVAVTTPSFAPADVNCDGRVDFQDLLQLLAHWGPCPGCPEDVNDSGEVEFQDLLTLLATWS